MQTRKDRQIVIIDAALEDRQTLLAGIPDDAEVVLLQQTDDGVHRIASALEGRSDITALHIICHGASGKLFLGATAIDLPALARYAAELSAIGNALTQDGELLIYGCEVAQGLEGRRFVEKLRSMTGLKVAAATHKVGAAELGGDWTLDVAPAIKSTPIQVSAWQGVLADAVLGGVETKGNLKVTVLEADGTMVIDRYDGTAWNTQFYDNDGVQTDGLYSQGVGSGHIIEINGATIALGAAAEYAVGAVYQQPSAVVTKDGQTITVVWTVDSSITDTFNNATPIIPNGTVVVTQRITLPSNDSQSVNVEWDVRNNTGGELSNVRLARVVDSFLAGGDEGYGFGDTKTGTVGVIKTVDGIRQKMTIQGLTPLTDMQSGYLDDVFDNAATVPDGLISDIDTATLQDNAYGIEWVIPTLANGATTTIKAVESFEAASVIPHNVDMWGRIDLAGGATTLLRFDVKNISASDQNTTFTVTVPDGWTAEIQQPDISYASSLTTPVSHTEDFLTIFVQVTIPAGVNPDNYNVILNINAEGDRSQSTALVSIDQPAIDLNGSEEGINLTLCLPAGSADGSNAVAFGGSATYTELDDDGAEVLAISYDPTQMVDGDTFYLNGAALDLSAPFGMATIAGNYYVWQFDSEEGQPSKLSFQTVKSFDTFELQRITGAQVETLLQSLKFGTTVESPDSGTRVFNVSALEGGDLDYVNPVMSPVATLTVNVGESLPTPYISGQEKILINEDANGELAISGFILGNALDADDTTTELTVSITAAHGTLRLTETSGITYAEGMTNGGTDETIEFTGSISNLRNAVNSLRYDPEDSNAADDPLVIKISADGGSTWQPYTVDVPGKFYYAPNGHYYEYVSANGITWDQAKAAAEAKTLYGLNGYLATVTSEAENEYIAPKLGGDGWMGASDAETEGIWKWVTGPEAGTHFFNGYLGAGTGNYSVDGSNVYGSEWNLIAGVDGTTVNVAVDSKYENWAEGEPNNYDSEDVAHFYGEGDNAGKWNDYANDNWDIDGYIVEYGGSGFGTLTAANLTIATNLKPVLSGVATGPINAGTESALQATPLRLDADVTLVEDSHTLNWNGEYSNYEKVAGRIDVAFVDENDNHILSSNNRISIVSNGDITVEADGDILYQGNYIGRTSAGINGNFRVVFDTKDTVSAAAVEKVIESITYTVNDAPVEATKLRYIVTDNTGQSSDPVDLIVNVTAENDAPTLTTSVGLIRSNITPEGWDDAYSVVTLGDGSIIVAGPSEGTIKLAKYDANGVLASGFGDGGIVETALSGEFDSPSIALDGDGKIVLVAADDDSGAVVAMRYKSDGTVDTDFAADTENIALVAEYGWYPKVAVLTDKSIAISFNCENEDENDAFAVAKLTTLGTLATGFGADGIQQIAIPESYSSEANDILISGTNIVVTGADTDNGDVVLAILDGTTGAETITTTSAATGDVWRVLDSDVEGIAIGKQSDGKIIVAGTADGDGLILARYNTNGTLDTSFGTNGKAAFTVMDYVQDVAIDSNDNIVVLSDDAMQVVRILANGSALDATFGEDGIATINGSTDPWGAEIKIASNGTIWVVGGDNDADDGAFNIAKLSANGVPDANFISKTTFTTLGGPVVLDGAISVYDGELSNDQNQDGFNGATLTIAREGGANEHDVFSAVDGGYLLLADGNVDFDGNTVGTFTQVGGTLTIIFNSNANRDNVNDIIRNIAYENTDGSITEATTVDLRWTFNDGNTGENGTVAQGSGGAKSATLLQMVNIVIGEAGGGDSDTTAPAYQSASINGTTLTLTYDEALGAAPEASAFSLKVNGQVVVGGIESVAINGSDNKILDLTLANPVFFGQKVTISYTDPSGDNDTNAIQDAAGNDAASFADYGVANNTAATSSVVIGSQLPGEQVTLAVGGGFSVNAPSNSAAPANLGKSIKMPMGKFAFNLTGLENGGTAQLSMTADADLKQLTYYKWNYLTNKYVNIAKSVSIDTQNNKATVFFDLVDGGAYDADREANGTIVDPGGVAENKLLPVILENETVIGDVRPLNTDQVNGTLSYSISGGADQAKFSINSNTGALNFKSAPNYETPNDLGDTLGNNTYAVTVTVTGSNGGSEIQPLIVTVMNVPEAGDPTVGSNVTAVEATLTVNAPPVTPPPVEPPPVTPPVVPPVTPPPVTPPPVVPPPVVPPVTPPETTPTAPPPVELVQVQATVTAETVSVTRTQTDLLTGQQVQVSVQTEQITVAPVSQGLGGENKAEVASVPLFWGESSRTEWATTALVPVGVQMQAEGSRAPVSGRTTQQVLNELVSMIDQTAPATDSGKATLLGGGQQFLQDLGSKLETLVVNKITLSAAPQAGGSPVVASAMPIVIQGTANTVQVAPGESHAPVEALVIDTRSLPAGSILDLKNIEFAVIVGDNVTVRGGAGANIFYAGTGSQNIKLGVDDDVLYAGDGDDWVGSAGGDDRVFGEAGNDILYGGIGNDYLDGGIGIDIALFAYSRAEYTLTQQQNGSWIISHAVEGSDTLVNIAFAEFADQTVSLGGVAGVNQLSHTNLVLF